LFSFRSYSSILKTKLISSGLFVAFITYCCLFLSGCFFFSAKQENILDNIPRHLSFQEALNTLSRIEKSVDSFKGRVRIVFKDKKRNKEKAFDAAVIYKKSEFFRLDAFTSLGPTYFKLYAEPNRVRLYIPVKKLLLSGDIRDLKFLEDKKWRIILPLASINLCHLIGIPHKARPLFIRQGLVSNDLFYAFDSGGYGVITFDKSGEKVVKNEQFDLNGTKVAQIQLKNYKNAFGLGFPCNISITDKSSDTYIKIELKSFDRLTIAESSKDFSLKIPESVKREDLAKIEDKLARWFILN